MGWIDEASKETEVNKKAFKDYFKRSSSKEAFVSLFYGDSSSGKTYTSLTFPKPLYIIDTENRADSNRKYNFPDADIHIFEPVEFKTDFDPKDDDALDIHKTIENITKFIIDYANEVKSGNIKGGTLVLDSCTDFWTYVQDWGINELAKRINKDGTKKADPIMMKINNQLDWGFITARHRNIIGTLKSLTNYNINIVFTAREKTIPEYIVKTGDNTLKDKIRCQMDLPFDADVIFNLKKVVNGNNVSYKAYCEKLGAKQTNMLPIELINYEKIKELMK